MKRTVPCMIAAFFCIAGIVVPAKASESQKTEFRGMWVATTLNLDYPSKTGLGVAELKAEADTILQTAADMGFTAVILQVRPSGDALYPSELFPWAECLTGQQGKAPGGDFDPLDYWIKEAHRRELELHAWINPLRVARSATAVLSDDNPARIHPEWTVTYKNGIYYDPGLPDVREYIINGVREVVEKYDVDGVQYDDYFYPGTDFADDGSFESYGGDFTDRGNWRRENTNQLIKGTYQAIKEIRSDCVFGVSPSGIWANKTSSPYGSETNGYEAYGTAFADTRRWVLNGWMDYVAPQIYWEIGYEKADFATLLNWWSGVVKGTGVRLYVGHASYRSGESKSGAWSGASEIERQIGMVRADAQAAGSIHFRYRHVADNRELKAALKRLYLSEPESILPAASAPMKEPPNDTLSIGRPAEDAKVTEKQFYLVGATDPNKAATLNGEAITERTTSGYFGKMVTLKAGENVFTLKQGDKTVTRRITLLTGSSKSSQPTMERAEIVTGTAFPVSRDEVVAPGDTVTLRCDAPVGASVSVRIGGQTITMKPDTTKASDDGKIYRTKYSASYTAPNLQGQGRVVPLGVPVYVMDYKGQINVCAADGALRVATQNAGYYAEVTSDYAFVYPKASTNGGSTGELSKGQVDYVTQVTGSGQWVKLSVGVWLQRTDVRLYNADTKPADITAAVLSTEDKWETLALTTLFPGATTVRMEGREVVLRVSGATTAPVPLVTGSGMIAEVTSKVGGGWADYTLKLKEGVRLDGYRITRDSKGIAFRLKRPLRVSAGPKPLEGFVIVIDAGHGGTDMGAIGPIGTEFTEEYFNLHAALKLQKELEALGAAVALTRSADRNVELAARANINYAVMPDLMISMHCNSMNYEVDSSKIRGLSTWYKQPLSEPLSRFVAVSANAELGTGKRGATQSNIYICRPFWAPSVLVEQAFICTPEDFEWMSKDANQNALAHAVANAVVGYFS